jgi:hypothetical protein
LNDLLPNGAREYTRAALHRMQGVQIALFATQWIKKGG